MVAGACIGFLRHNFFPARIFMGDSGALVLGYTLATVSVAGLLKTASTVVLFLPLLVLAVPIVDTSFVVAKRLKHGRPVYSADRWHLHHRFVNIGFSQRRAALTMWAWCGDAGGGGARDALRPVPRRRRLASVGDLRRRRACAHRPRVLRLRRVPARDRQAREPAHPPARGRERARAEDRVTTLPQGTVTFVFTDIAGSTALLKQLGDAYADALAVHRRLIRDAFRPRGGQEMDTQGDAFFFCFGRARDAVAAAVAAQRALAAHPWPDGAPLTVRMSLHTGEPVVGEEGYVGIDVHRAARICAAGHGGQVLLSSTTAALVAGSLPEGVREVELGDVKLKDIDRAERIYQLSIEGLPGDFPPLRVEGDEPLDLDARIEQRVERFVAQSIEQALSGIPGPGTAPRAGSSPGLKTTKLAAFGLLNLVLLVATVIVDRPARAPRLLRPRGRASSPPEAL